MFHFTNVLLALGALAFAIPLIIHILNKRRFQVVDWAAWHLLEEILRKNNQRIRIEQLLLLLLRILIPVLLAFCLARPVLEGVKALLGSQKTSTVFLLDNSFSMQAGGATNGAYVRAKEAVDKIAKTLPNGSDASLVLMGGRARSLTEEPTTSLETITTRLTDTAGTDNAIRPADSLRLALGELGKMSNGAKEIVVLSDFRARDWQGSAGVERASAMQELERSPLKPAVTLLTLGNEGGENLAVESVQTSSLILAKGQRFTLRATVKNYGKAAYPDLPVSFSADGQLVRSSRVNVAANGEAQVLFTHTFNEAGSHALEIKTEGDAVKEDNIFYAILPVWDEVPVLLVNGVTGRRPLEGATDFLEIALQPFGATGTRSLNDLIVSKTVPTNQLSRDQSKEKRVIALANVSKLENHQREELKEFVKLGGGLIIFGGSQCDLTYYNNDLYENGGGLLPAKIKGLGGVAGKSRSGAAHVINQQFSHPTLDFFNDARNGRLSEAEITSWFQLDVPAATDKNQPTTNVLARLDNGDPFLVEKAYGEGRVIFCATTANPDWNNLPTHPTFVPLMQRLTAYLAASVAPPLNLEVGSPLRVLLGGEEGGKKRLLIDPAGKEFRIDVRKENDRRSVLEFDRTALPGIYTLMPADGVRQPPQRFAYNVSRLESDLTPLSNEVLDQVGKEMKATVVRSVEEYQALDKTKRFGIEFWKPFLWALLAFLFAELFLQQWIGRRV